MYVEPPWRSPDVTRRLRAEALARLQARAPARIALTMRRFWLATLPANALLTLDAWALLPNYSTLLVAQAVFWIGLVPLARWLVREAAQLVLHDIPRREIEERFYVEGVSDLDTELSPH